MQQKSELMAMHGASLPAVHWPGAIPDEELPDMLPCIPEVEDELVALELELEVAADAYKTRKLRATTERTVLIVIVY